MKHTLFLLFMAIGITTTSAQTTYYAVKATAGESHKSKEILSQKVKDSFGNGIVTLVHSGEGSYENYIIIANGKFVEQGIFVNGTMGGISTPFRVFFPSNTGEPGEHLRNKKLPTEDGVYILKLFDVEGSTFTSFNKDETPLQWL